MDNRCHVHILYDCALSLWSQCRRTHSDLLREVRDCDGVRLNNIQRRDLGWDQKPGLSTDGHWTIDFFFTVSFSPLCGVLKPIGMTSLLHLQRRFSSRLIPQHIEDKRPLFPVLFDERPQLSVVEHPRLYGAYIKPKLPWLLCVPAPPLCGATVRLPDRSAAHPARRKTSYPVQTDLPRCPAQPFCSTG